MSTLPATPLFIDGIDSYYFYVKNRILQINPARVFGGIVQARDWPMKEAQLEVPYLLLQREDPKPFGRSVSWFRPMESMQVRWAWMIQGDNIQANAQSTNRGNKYRINGQMIQELLNGSYPGFCKKYQYSAVDDGTGKAEKIAVAYDPTEFVKWSMPRFSDTIDSVSGILYCTGIVGIHDFAPAPPLSLQ